jgi:predicted dehydrogenase
MRGVNRRTFLASAGSGTAALALGSGVKAAGANDQIRVAVIGIRSRGQSHIDAFTQNKATSVVALCDVDSRLFSGSAKTVEDRTGKAPALVTDLRRIMDDKNIDVVTIATPNHWHALAAVWACQAGKDVYVEKPVSHNVSEGRKIADAAKKYDRLVQTGTQNRSSKGVIEAMDFLHSGKLGKVYLSKGLCYKPRGSIGIKADAVVPEGVDYNIWQGPAPEQPFNPNRFHYEWHWNWNYGNGDLGNQGIHQMDLARWGLNKNELPIHIVASGGRYGYKDDGQTPNTQIASYKYDDCMLEFEVRGLPTNAESGIKIGNLFYGTEGVLVLNEGKWQTFFGHKNEPGPSGQGGGDHFGNFVQALQSRKREMLHAEVTEGHLSSALCHLGNISYRLGRALKLDPKTETFLNDKEADAMLTREYRSPFTMPDKV